MKIMDARSGVSSSAGEFRLTKAAFPSRSVRRRLLLRDSLSDRMNPQSIREFETSDIETHSLPSSHTERVAVKRRFFDGIRN